jgi:hypothetical protein
MKTTKRVPPINVANVTWNATGHKILSLVFAVAGVIFGSAFIFGQVPEWYVFYTIMGIVSIIFFFMSMLMLGIAIGIRLVEKNGFSVTLSSSLEH